MAKKVDNKKPEKKVEVETIKTVEVKSVKPAYVSKRVSGGHRVKFLPNGANGKLGIEIKKIAATTAQLFVDNGWGNIVE